MRNPTVVFARPGRSGSTGEPIEFSHRRHMGIEPADWLQWPDPRTGPADRMSSDGFLAWFCGGHTNLERNILIDEWVRHLRKAVDRKMTLFLRTAEPPALRVDMKIGRIHPDNLKSLRKHAKARALEVRAIEDTRNGVRGAACYVGFEIVGVFSGRDVIVLER